MDDLTPSQLALYELIREFQWKRRYSPSIRDLVKILGLRSKSRVGTRIKTLCELGYIEKSPIGTIMFPREGLNQAYFDSFLV